MQRIFRRLMRAFCCASEPSEKSGHEFVMWAARSQSSIWVKRISSVIVSTLIISSFVLTAHIAAFWRRRLRRSRRLHRSRPERSGGVLRRSTCGHEPIEGALCRKKDLGVWGNAGRKCADGKRGASLRTGLRIEAGLSRSAPA